MRVLIIDDDEAMIGIWTTVLKKDAIEVLTASTGKLGIELAIRSTTNLALRHERCQFHRQRMSHLGVSLHRRIVDERCREIAAEFELPPALEIQT